MYNGGIRFDKEKTLRLFRGRRKRREGVVPAAPGAGAFPVKSRCKGAPGPAVKGNTPRRKAFRKTENIPVLEMQVPGRYHPLRAAAPVPSCSASTEGLSVKTAFSSSFRTAQESPVLSKPSWK